MDKPDFIGKAALERMAVLGRGRPSSASMVMDATHATAHGGDSILSDGRVVGSVTSVGWGHRVGKNIAMGFVDPRLRRASERHWRSKSSDNRHRRSSCRNACMIPKICASAPEFRQAECLLVEILLAPGFVATELAIAFDSFRIANRMAGRDLFRLRIVSIDSESTLSSLGGIGVSVQPLKAVTDLPDLIIVTGGLEMARALRKFLPRLQRVRHAGGIAVALSDAAQALLTAGAAETAAVHWEGRPVLEEAGLAERGSNVLYTRSGSLATSAGMAATADVVLALIAEMTTPALMREVARVLLLDRLRMANTEQPKGTSALVSLPEGPLREALKTMETTLEFPRSTSQIARGVGLSTRQLERLFARYLGKSPQAYYRDLRLHRARTLIETSNLSLTEIALSCGFETPAHFARVFKLRYGMTPRVLRSSGL